MEFSGTFELDDTTLDEVWLAMSDPELIEDSLPGCRFLVRVDDPDDVDFDALREEHAGDEPELTADPEVIRSRAFEEGATYAALIEVSVGSVSPSFETVVTVDEREKPEMAASGEGSAGNSSFEGSSRMELSETDDGVAVDWEAEADVFGRIAQMGQRVVNPVANRVTKRFFQSIQERLRELDVEADDGGGEREATTGDDGAEGDGADEAADDGTDDTADATAAGDAEAGDTGGGTDAAGSDGDDGGSTARSDATDAEAGDAGAPQARDDREDGNGGIVARLRRLLGMG